MRDTDRIGWGGPTDSPDHPLLMAGAFAVCGLGVAGSVWPALDRVVWLVLAGALVVASLTVVARLLARLVRERREDRADLAAGARWRAIHSTSRPVSTAGSVR